MLSIIFSKTLSYNVRKKRRQNMEKYNIEQYEYLNANGVISEILYNALYDEDED
jgi:hypothetical protein